MSLKGAARGVLHHMGGLAALRFIQRGKFRVLMFHEFHERNRANVDHICEHICRHFEPVSLTRMVGALRGEENLPANALTITVDDGYRNFLEQGHSIFRKHRIPTTVYAVAGFANGELWLWTDRIAFAIEHTDRGTIRGGAREFDVTSPQLKAEAIEYLWEAWKEIPNEQRRRSLEDLERSCAVDLPALPPPHRRSLTWDELRALAAEGVEIGCHTYSHPILSRVESAPELEHEIRGAKELIEEKLGATISHFCYPNGRDMDIGDAAPDVVRNAGYTSCVTCTYGLNTPQTPPLRIMRVPFDDKIDFQYGVELLAGLHL